MAELKKREKIMVSVALSTLMSFLLNTFVCSDAADELPPATITAPVAALETKEIPTKSGPKKVTRRKVADGERMRFVSWSTDPFLDTIRLTELDSAGTDSSDFALRGIIWKGSEAHALIGDLILKEGERQGDVKVLDIGKDMVVCKKGTRVVTLTMRHENE